MNYKARMRRRAAVIAQQTGADAAGGLGPLIARLNPGDRAHWTTAGLPDCRVLSELSGRHVSAAERNAYVAQNPGAINESAS